MENDLKYKITEYFNFDKKEREEIIQELTEFYFERNVSLRTMQEFEISIGQLIFQLGLEYKFALKAENYNRVEIYDKLYRIFTQIRDKYFEENGRM